MEMDLMTKNFTVSLTDEIVEFMNEYPEVNWSKIVKLGIIEYIRIRLEAKGQSTNFLDELAKKVSKETYK